MSMLSQGKWLSEHRRWEDVLSACLGILVILSPWIAAADHGQAVTISAGLAGFLIIALALLEMVQLRRWEEGLEALCGLWVIVSPFVFGFDGTLRWLSFALGGAVVALAAFEYWQDRQRKL